MKQILVAILCLSFVAVCPVLAQVAKQPGESFEPNEGFNIPSPTVGGSKPGIVCRNGFQRVTASTGAPNFVHIGSLEEPFDKSYRRCVREAPPAAEIEYECNRLTYAVSYADGVEPLQNGISCELAAGNKCHCSWQLKTAQSPSVDSRVDTLSLSEH